MKKTLILISAVLAALLGACILVYATADSGGHVLSDMWKKYDLAKKADLPKKQMQILQEIKSDAILKRCAWDYFDACEETVDVGTSMNWKLRDSLGSAFASEIEAYGDPMLMLHYKLNYAYDCTDFFSYVKKNEAALKASHTPELYSRNSLYRFGPVGALVSSLCGDDYVFALWASLNGSNSVTKDKVEAELISCFGDAYPQRALMEFVDIYCWKSSTSSKDAYREYAKKHEGKAVALLARERLLAERLDSLEAKEIGTSDDFKALRRDCETFISDAKKFSGDEKKIAECCKVPSALIERLDAAEASISIKDGKVALAVRNINKCEFSLRKDGKSVFSKKLVNTTASYYRRDTLLLDIPQTFDDGDYEASVEHSGGEQKIDYHRHTISLALRDIRDGKSIYAADYMSGEPVRKVDLTLYDRNDAVVATAGDVALVGFTPLPESILKKIRSNPSRNYYIVCSAKDRNGRLRTSDKNSVWGWDRNNSVPSDISYAKLLTDCGAYNPGDVAHFKAIFYKGCPDNGYKVFAQGATVTAKLLDAEFKEVSSKVLKTDEYGSVDGEFPLPTGRKGGRWCISVTSGKSSDNAYIVVDEYVLPEYELTFDKIADPLFVGDKVTVGGSVKSYSGHSLSGARILWNVSCAGEVAKGEQKICNDGSFSFDFQHKMKDGWGAWYRISVKVVDATGETREFSKSLRLFDELNVGASLLNKVEGDYVSAKAAKSGSARESRSNDLGIVDGDARLYFDFLSNDKLPVSQRLKLSLTKDGKLVRTIECGTNEDVAVDLSQWTSGLFGLRVEARVKDQNGKEYVSDRNYSILKVSDSVKVLDEPLSDYWRKISGDGIKLQIGDAKAPLWALVQLWGEDSELLRSSAVHLSGARGKAGSLDVIEWDYPLEYPDEVVMTVFYFRDGTYRNIELRYSRPVSKYTLPLAISRLTDSSRPDAEVKVGFKTSPDADAVVTVFDKSTETIASNRWSAAYLASKSVYAPGLNVFPGRDMAFYPYYKMADNYGAKKMYRAAASTRADFVNLEEEESMPLMSQKATLDTGGLDMETAEPEVRSDFKAALAFLPHVRPDADGNAEFSFHTSDRLSTYIVQIFVHDKSAHSAATRQEMLVTVPVKLSAVQPQYLYKGDRYVLNATLSNSSNTAVGGVVTMQLFNGDEYDKVKNTEPLATVVRRQEALSSGATAALSFEIGDYDVKTLGVKLSFKADGGDLSVSDAVFFAVPVYDNVQTITEAHSAVLLAGGDREAVLADLRSRFVNMQPYGAECREISVLDMVREALPELSVPECENVLDLTDAYYANALSASLPGSPAAADSLASVQKALLDKILACEAAEGGFAWFKGMYPSPVITAVVLQRFAGLRDRGLMDTAELSEVIAKACHYLDRVNGTVKTRPYWCGGISLEQYLHVRSMYPSVDLAVKPEREVRKAVSAYLVPKKERGLNGLILSKARRLLTLRNFLASEDGIDLASSLGVRLRAKKMASSMKADSMSLEEYAQPHKSGGSYYPNAVLPYRGLLESEAYAHALLCDLFKDSNPALADNIRLWLMLQKETQKWSDDPGFVEALASILDGSQAVLDTRVIVLTKRIAKPFAEIKAAGNGFTVARSYAKIASDGSRTALSEGDTLHIGDKIVASYAIWSGENRSFVRLNAPRPACLRPENQISGHYGWWARPISVDGWYTCVPQGYRWVRAESTEFWFDSYPEEKTTLTESFYVTQEGSFTSPAVEIESLYAPHYRANDGFGGLMTTVK